MGISLDKIGCTIFEGHASAMRAYYYYCILV